MTLDPVARMLPVPVAVPVTALVAGPVGAGLPVAPVVPVAVVTTVGLGLGTKVPVVVATAGEDPTPAKVRAPVAEVTEYPVAVTVPLA